MMSNNYGEEMLSSSHLDPCGFNIVMGERSSLGGLQRASFQTFKKCKGRDLVWEKGSPHERSTKGKERRRHPQVIEWMWLMRKELGSYLQIYDIGQQETWIDRKSVV